MAILDSSHVFLDCSAATRDEALELAANKAVELGATSDAAALLEGLKAREAEGSTGMMGGFAIPHCKSALVSDPCIVVLRFSEPVEWQAMDKAPVDCAIALFIPDGELGTRTSVVPSRAPRTRTRSSRQSTRGSRTSLLPRFRSVCPRNRGQLFTLTAP